MRDFKDLKIAVAGTGYVGLSIATLLSQHHKVMAVDIVPEKVELINNKSPQFRTNTLKVSGRERTEFNCNTGCKGSI